LKHHIALVGCGGIASVWVKAISNHPDCRIALTYDLDGEAAGNRATETGAKVATSYEEALASPEIDIVLICTPTFTHKDLTIQAAAAGKHVLCEKPMELTIGNCREMVDACADAHVKLAIGHSIRFWGAFLKTRRLIAEGLIGTPCLAQVHRIGATGARLAGRVAEIRKRKPWRFDTRYSGGNLLESSVHELDYCRSIFGEVASVYAEVSGKEDYDGYESPIVLQAIIRFEMGASVVFRQGGIVAYPSRGSWVAGTRGMLAFDEWDGAVTHHNPDADGPQVIGTEEVYAYDLELQDLVDAVEKDHEPENSGTVGLKNIALGLAMYRSIETGQAAGFTSGMPDDVPDDYQYRGPNAFIE
jgi:predicted dehydrogenase